MAPQYTRADSLREYLSGALVDGGLQTDPNGSNGGYRSSVEATSLGMVIANAIVGTVPLYAGGANLPGPGLLTAVDANHLTWQPFGATSPGPPTQFSGSNDIEIVEANGLPGQYLRVQGTPPFTPSQATITLSYLADDVFSLDDVSIANASAGISEYRATFVRNEATGAVTAFQRWIATLGAQQISNMGGLPAGSVPGTITTSGNLTSWPTTGWCQVANSVGAVKEVVYYTGRTNTQLTVPANGRGLLGTSPVAGSTTDIINPVPGVAIGLDPVGIQPFGRSIQLASPTPGGVTWNLGITSASGLQIGTLGFQQQIGIWIWRQIPAGTISTPAALNKFLDNFNAF